MIARLAENAATEVDGRPHRFKRVGGKLLWHQTDFGARRPVVGNDVMTVCMYRPAGGTGDAADDIDQGRLAGAVRAEQGEDFAATYLKVDSF